MSTDYTDLTGNSARCLVTGMLLDAMERTGPAAATDDYLRAAVRELNGALDDKDQFWPPADAEPEWREADPGDAHEFHGWAGAQAREHVCTLAREEMTRTRHNCGPDATTADYLADVLRYLNRQLRQPFEIGDD